MPDYALRDAISTLIFLLRQEINENVLLEDILEEINISGKVKLNNFDELKQKFKIAKDLLINKFNNQHTITEQLAKSFPILLKLSAESSVVTKFDPENFNIYLGKEYRPKLKLIEPVLNIKLVIDKFEEEETVNFAVTKVGAEQIIKFLTHSVIELDSLSEYLKNKKD